MHPLENGVGVPAFLAKLWRLVEDSSTNHLISWSSDGKSFIIQNQAKFAKELLPLNYKHNNMASFIRQLNMYGFHKITSIDNGGLKFDRDEMEFSHPYFQKGHPYLLEHIKRKIANPKQVEPEKTSTKSETVNRVLVEVKNMKGRQDSLDTRFSAMKQENEALWREVAILRQKHLKQQQIVNKLIQFLVTIVQPQRSGLSSGIGKRRGQLMLHDVPQTKLQKISTGPVIRELTEELLEEVEDELEDAQINLGNVQSPGSSSSKDLEGASNNEDLDLEDIDEIDTNNMEIYSGGPIKRERVSGAIGFENLPNISPQEQQQSTSDKSDSTSQNKKSQSQLPGKSLLIPSKSSAAETSGAIDADIMMNVLNDQGMADVAGTSGTSGQAAADSSISRNTMFDESSQPPSDLLDDELFGFDTKPVSQQGSVPDMTVTKYNPKHSNDILRLNSVDDYSSHLDNVQNDLDSLKDLLRGDSYSLNADQLLGLFGGEGEDIIGYELSPSNLDLFADDKKDENQSGSRSELMTYQPSPYNNNLDLNELLQNVGDVDGLQNE